MLPFKKREENRQSQEIDSESMRVEIHNSDPEDKIDEDDGSDGSSGDTSTTDSDRGVSPPTTDPGHNSARQKDFRPWIDVKEETEASDDVLMDTKEVRDKKITERGMTIMVPPVPSPMTYEELQLQLRIQLLHQMRTGQPPSAPFIPVVKPSPGILPAFPLHPIRAAGILHPPPGPLSGLSGFPGILLHHPAAPLQLRGQSPPPMRRPSSPLTPARSSEPGQSRRSTRSEEQENAPKRQKDIQKAKDLGLTDEDMAGITKMGMEEFNEYCQRRHFSEEQIQYMRDVRRKGKNKIAAQNCRKRKIENIEELEKKVEQGKAVLMEKQKKNRKMEEDKENKLSQAKELRMLLNKNGKDVCCHYHEVFTDECFYGKNCEILVCNNH